MIDSPEQRSNPEGERKYRAPYFEVTVAKLNKDRINFLRKIVSDDIDVGSTEHAGDIRIRRFNLPKDPEERKKRILEIQEKGTDRTDPNFQTPYDRRVYIPAAQNFGLDPMNIFDADPPVSFYRHPEEVIEDHQDPSEPIHHARSNGILVYDAKTEKGIYSVVGPEYTFKDLSKRKEALLAIIGIFEENS